LFGYKIHTAAGGSAIDTTGRDPDKPDILLPYPEEEDGLTDRPERSAYAVVYVRPETNTILYERAIVSGIRKRGDKVIFTANINGSLFLRDRILEEHYASQFRFAADPREELARYPEIASRVEAHFGVRADGASILGAFEAVSRLGVPEETLFGSFMPDAEFLTCWGQQFKRFGGAVVVNPHLPAILKRYTPSANVFVVAVRSKDGAPDFFTGLNRGIYEEITARVETPVLHGSTLEPLAWQEKVRRTYHISRTHLMALFDMAAFVYRQDGSRLAPEAAPLGRELVRRDAATPDLLRVLMHRPLVYTGSGAGASLHYLPLAGAGRGVEAAVELMGRLRGESPPTGSP
jgi:hypothetical protein